MSTDHHPRKRFEEAVRYAIQLTENYLAMWRGAGLDLADARLLELGPGSDFAPHLVLASLGARVTLADKYLASWDDAYHPAFYSAFLDHWSGPADAVRQAIKRNGYDGLLQTTIEPAEQMRSLQTGSFDIVQSNAVLEHVSDFRTVGRELARLTRPGGVHAHQIDFRDHRNFEKPLEYLRLDRKTYEALIGREGSVDGTARRLPEAIDAFSRYFWIWRIEINCRADAEYVKEVASDLPPESPYRSWPVEPLRDVGGRLWMIRKDTKITLLDRLLAR